MGSKGTARVCLYGDHLAGAFQEFCRVIWPGSTREIGSGTTIPGSQSTAAGRSATEVPTFVFLKDERVVGHVTTIPVQLSLPSGVKSAHWIVGFMVLPEYRSGLVGPLLIKEANRVLDCAMSLHVEPPVLRILTGLKWVYKGVLPQYLRVLNARAVVKNLQPAVAEAVGPDSSGRFLRSFLKKGVIRWMGSVGFGFGQGVWSGLNGLSRLRQIHTDIQWEERFDDGYTHLWQSVSGQLSASVVRDRAALEFRYGQKLKRYRLLASRQGKQLKGYCIVRLKQFSGDARLGNMKVGTIVDCLYDPLESPVMHSLIAHILKWAREEGVDALLCTASLKPIRQTLVKNGFFKIPGNLNFAYHSRSPLGGDDISLDSWHLMRGDSDADQNF